MILKLKRNFCTVKKLMLMLGLATCAVSSSVAQSKFNPDQEIAYCALQAAKTLKQLPSGSQNLPRSIAKGQKSWRYVNYADWCSGFWPGTLWYLYEGTQNAKWKLAADKFTRQLSPLAMQKAADHDLGFMVFNSFGNGYRLVQQPGYKRVILNTADTLATLFNPKAGTILSWPSEVKPRNWPHNTIIDNMINLELLFWAANNGGSRNLYNIAVKHAQTTMLNHFRPDYSAYHVVVYDTISGKKIKGVTHQGYADNSMWARGQSWAIYGFTMCYRETRNPAFLDFAEKVADVYLKRLPADKIPYWDFEDPAIPNAPKDASAASITASALLELSTFVGKQKSNNYKRLATAMLEKLSAAQYQSRHANNAFLLHSTGHHPNGSEIDASIIYADYYYLEALLRLKKLNAHQPIR